MRRKTLIISVKVVGYSIIAASLLYAAGAVCTVTNSEAFKQGSAINAETYGAPANRRALLPSYFLPHPAASVDRQRLEDVVSGYGTVTNGGGYSRMNYGVSESACSARYNHFF
ncbi:hypothetical protein HYX10_03030 [Candidatus Woesearchaeota archaeon]|nr:hypothetical protein [Candidatus Woesearchaeota archaeon]